MVDEEMTTQSKPTTVYQMRQSGATLEQIGSHFGISRERVRQLLVKYYGTSEIDGLLTVAELARLTGCSRDYIRKLKQQGIIGPLRIHRKNRLWKVETIATIILYKDGHRQRCRVCNRPLPNNRRMFCSEACHIKAQAHRHKNRPGEAKRRHNERVRRWREEHPEQAKQIQQGAQRKYLAKKLMEKYNNRRYVVRGKCAIPNGTIIRALGCQACRLKVEWQGEVIDVPVSCVRIVG